VVPVAPEMSSTLDFPTLCQEPETVALIGKWAIGNQTVMSAAAAEVDESPVLEIMHASADLPAPPVAIEVSNKEGWVGTNELTISIPLLKRSGLMDEVLPPSTDGAWSDDEWDNKDYDDWNPVITDEEMDQVEWA